MLSAGVVMHVWSVCGMNAVLLAGALLHVKSDVVEMLGYQPVQQLPARGCQGCYFVSRAFLALF